MSALRARLVAALVVGAPALLAAQAPQPALPASWQVKLDQATMPADYAFVTAGTGFHATTGRAAGVFFDTKAMASETYHLDATFTQTKAPAHPEAYGLVFGGKGLDTERADYGYFLVRGDGKYLVKHRASNGDVHTLVDWTASPAVQVADAAGKATNALRVDVGRDSIRFFANGARLTALPRALNTNGTYGVRVNHALDVHIEGPNVTPTR